MNMDWIECVRWCHALEDEAAVDIYIETLVDLCRRSRYASPILTKMQDRAGFRVAGYVVLYPGALASVGNLRMDPCDHDLGSSSQIELAKDLFRDAFRDGAEMVQAISPLIASNATFALNCSS